MSIAFFAAAVASYFYWAGAMRPAPAPRAARAARSRFDAAYAIAANGM